MSHLPLLFADGHPTCLDRITLPQLERFVPFMVQCCPRSKKSPPPWWPKEIPFIFPLKCPPQLRKQWMPLLKNIVIHCYVHYESMYVLNFCRKLALLGSKRLCYKENDDRLDIIERTSNKLLVSVKSKNKTYDQPTASPRKSLLLRPLPGQPSFESQPVIDDIYLCSHCDAEFTCCKDACEHERTVHAPKVEDQSTPQEKHLRALGLVPATQTLSTSCESVSKPRRITSNLNLKKCHSIPICTPLGSLLLANSQGIKPHEVTKAQDRLEQYCSTDEVIVSETNGTRRSRRVPGGSLARFRNPWNHQYCFNKKQRAERMETIRTGLDKDSRRLLKRCRLAKTTIRRLPPLPRNTTIDLRRLKDFIAEEFPKQIILEAHKPPPPPPPPVVVNPPLVHRSLDRHPSLMNQMYIAFNNRPPLAGVPTNQMFTNFHSNSGIITKMVPFRQLPVRKQQVPVRKQQVPVRKRQVPSQPPAVKTTSREEPVVIDLCSSDDECEIIAIPEKTKESYPPLVNAPKYGVTAASPKENCPKVTETELASIPVKDNHPTVLYVQQFCRSRS